MTFYQAVSEAKEWAMAWKLSYTVYSFRPHWWWFRQYDFNLTNTGFYYTLPNYRMELVIQSDGKTH
jgi:hypothetical protein